MKKLTWVCIMALLFTVMTGCGNWRLGSLPNELKRTAPEESAKSAEDDAKEFGIQSLPPADDNINRIDSLKIKHQKVSLYFWDKDNNKLVPEVHSITFLSDESMLREVVEALVKGPDSETLKPVLPGDTKVLNVEQAENIVEVNLSSHFLGAENLLAARAALVNTLTELEEVKYVKIYVESNELTSDGSEKGEALGILTKYSNNLDEVVANEKREIAQDTVKEVDRELYFSDFRNKYLLPEVRTITVKNNEVAKAIVEELQKGPVNDNEGLYPTLPSGTQLLKANLVKGQGEGEPDGLELYFSKELQMPFREDSPKDTAEPGAVPRNGSLKNNRKEQIILSSLVYSLTALPNVEWVKIYYQNDEGEYVDYPLYSIPLTKPLSREDFPEKLGRRLKIYFSDKNAMYLVPEYRAMNKNNLQIATTIINELILGPQDNTDHGAVIPQDIAVGDIKIRMDEGGSTAIVDLPPTLDGNKMGSTGVLMTLYAIVNSLTDPVNTRNIKQVQFTVGGEVVESFGNMELSEPFIRNPAIIKEK